MRRALVVVEVLWVIVAGAVSLGHAASVRNIYFTKGQVVAGQTYRTEGQLPGPATEFVKGQDPTARLLVVFGDLDAHQIEGELKAADGRVVRRFKQEVQRYNQPASWRFTTRGIDLATLKPGEYTLDVKIDGEARGSYKFTLTAP